MIRRWKQGVVVTGALVCAFLPADAQADRRVALVIGNSNYEKVIKLPNPANDATDVAKVLRDLDFKVIEIEDADKNQFDRKLAEFARGVLDADAAMFFYAGHGIQVAGKNYLLPIDADIADETDVEFGLEAVDRVRQAIDKAPSNSIKIMVLDACRNNPLSLKTAERGLSPIKRGLEPVARGVEPLSRGLARIDQQGGGLIVVYATQSDQVAQDGNERNSPFTSAFLKRLTEPGLEIGTLFRRVTSDVSNKTGGKQVPEVSISLGGDYYLNRSETDTLAWPKVRDSSDPQAFRDFVARYPTSFLVPDAKHRIEQLEAGGQAVKDKLAQEEAARVTAQAQENVKRLAAEKQVKEDAERKAKEEQQRVAKAEGDRLAAEKAQKELADRKAKEEADRMAAAAAENARRLAAEQVAKEEALRLAKAEADRRKAEEAKAAAEKAQKELAERKAKEEAERLAAAAAETAKRLAAEKAQKDEADRRKAEEQRLAAEKLAKEDNERLAKLELERLAKLGQERQAKADVERLAAVEREKQARVAAEKAANEEAARGARAEADVEAKRIQEMEAARIAAAKAEAEDAKARQAAAEQAERDNAARAAADEADAKRQQEAKLKADAAVQAAQEQAERDVAARLARDESEKRAAEQAARVEVLRRDAEESARLAKLEDENKQAEQAAAKAQAEAEATRLAAADAKANLEAGTEATPADGKPPQVQVADLERTVQDRALGSVATPVAQPSGQGWMAAAWDRAVEGAAVANLPGLAGDVIGQMASLAPANASLDAAPAVPSVPVEPEANTPDLVKAAQTELIRVGCLWGAANGKLSDRTLNGLDAYAQSHGRGEFKSGGKVKITARFIEELKAQDGTVCRAAASKPPDAPPVVEKPIRRPPPTVRHAPEPDSPPVVRHPVRPAAPAAAAPRPPRPKPPVEVVRRPAAPEPRAVASPGSGSKFAPMTGF